MKKVYSSILNVSVNASPQEIKKAYRFKAKLWHPDVNSSPEAKEMFIKITEAYEYLINQKNNKSNFSLKRPKQSSGKFEKENIRKKAKVYAEMKFEEFKATEFYKTTEASIHLIEQLSIVFAYFIILGIPIIGLVYYGFLGILIGGGMVLVMSPFWVPLIVQKKHTFSVRIFYNSFAQLIKSRYFKLVILTLINMFFIYWPGLFTLVSIWIFVCIFILIIIMGFLLSLFFFKPRARFKSFMIAFGFSPLIINLFFLINYLFSSNPNVETYPIIHDRELIGYERYAPTRTLKKTTLIHLPNNVYNEYPGIRFFLDYNYMKNKKTITYTFENGLFGIRVLKFYEFN